MKSGRWLVLDATVALAVFAVLVTRVPTVEHFLANNDHGYQLAAASELLRGRVPGVDVFINYGPLVVLFSTAALAPRSDSLLVEVLVCALAWALAVAMAFRLIRRNFGMVAGLTTALAAFVCIPRFHKWWVWMVPLAALAAIDAARALPGPRRWFAGGLVCGLGALVRPDLGVAPLAALALIGLADEVRERGLGWPRAWWPLALGFSVPPVAWGAIVLAVAGIGGLTRAIAVIPEMVFGTVASLNLPPPILRWDDPFSAATAHALALRLLPVTAALALGVGWWLFRDRRRGLDREGRALLAIGIVGLSSLHHTVYRADIHHLWQGIWPLTLALPGLCVVVVRLARADAIAGLRRAPGVILTTAVALLAVLAGPGLWPILKQPHFDLAPYGRPVLAGLAAVRQGITAAPDHPYARLVGTITQLTEPGDEILVLVYGPQLLFFAQRPTSGPTVAFQRGLFDTPAWQRQRLTALQAHPPALVIVPMAFWQLGPEDELRAALPEIYDFVRTHYRRIVDRRGRYMLLAPDPTFRAPSS